MGAVASVGHKCDLFQDAAVLKVAVDEVSIQVVP